MQANNTTSQINAHEHLLEMLSAILLQLNALQTVVHNDKPDLNAMRNGLASMEQITREAIHEIRSSSDEIPLPELVGFTLVEALSHAVDATAERLGLLEILWSVDSGDSLGANWAGIIRNVEAGLRPGAIILMHENRGQTIRALTTLLPELHRRHLRSVSLPELFASDPPSREQLQAGGRGCAVSGARGSGG